MNPAEATRLVRVYCRLAWIDHHNNCPSCYFTSHKCDEGLALLDAFVASMLPGEYMP